MKASLKHLRISTRKVRLVSNLIKGLSVVEAERELIFLNKKSSQPVLKLLRSAVANAKSENNIEKDNLYISNIIVNQGPTLKRWRARAMGRAAEIRKRTSHVTIELAARTPLVKKEKAQKKEEVGETKLIPEEKQMPELKERGEVSEEKAPIQPAKVAPAKPYATTSQSKKKFFSRQTFGNAKKIFRRKSF